MNRVSTSVRLVCAAVLLAAASSFPLPGAPWIAPGLACAAWTCLAVAFANRDGSRRAIAPPAPGAWGTWKDARDLTRRGPLLLGLWPGSHAPLYLDDEQVSGHVLILGPSRAGKTAGVIAPNVLLRDPSGESLVVLDVKTGPRSLWNVTAGRYGPRAHLFCPLFDGSIRYNPLDRVRTIGDAQRAATLLIRNTTPRDLSGDAQVYASAAADLAALLFLQVQHERATGGHTVGAVYRMLLGGAGAVRAALAGSSLPEVRDRTGVFAARERRVREAAVTGLLQRLAPWGDPAVDETTTGHWDLGTLGRRPTALYVLLPEPDAARLQPLIAWLIADLLDTLIEQADQGERRCPVRVYLDEFRRFGYLAGLSDRLPTLRERGVSVLLGAQVLSQIEEVYGDRGARTLIANMETKLIFRAGDLETARLVSAWLGLTTVPVISRTVAAGRPRATVHPHVRPLALPEEIARMPDGTVLALAGARKPFVLRQARYFDPAMRTVLPVSAPPPFPLRARSGPVQRSAVSPLGALPPERTGPVGAQRTPLRRRVAPRPQGGVYP